MATAPPNSPRYEAKPRWGHCGALVEGKLVVYGGHFGANGGIADSTSFDILDPITEEWTQMPLISGTLPPDVVYASCAAVGPTLYHIGGSDEGNAYNLVHHLDVLNKRWAELHPANPEEAPMKKYGAAGISYGNTIVTVGGYGVLPTNHHPGVEYIPDPEREGQGWTNEVVCYDTEQSE